MGGGARHLDWDLALWLDFADDPLVAYQEMDGERERVGSVVSRRLSASVLASLGLWDRVQLGLELPLVLSQTGESVPGLMLAEPTDVGRADCRSGESCGNDLTDVGEACG